MFYVWISSRVNEGKNVLFVTKKEGVLVRINKRFYHVVIPDTLKSIIVHLSHFYKMVGQMEDVSCNKIFRKLSIGLRYPWNDTRKYELSIRVHKTRWRYKTSTHVKQFPET